MPFRFLFGGGKKEVIHSEAQGEREVDEISDDESEGLALKYTEDFDEVYFMNPNFGSSFRSNSTSPHPGLTHRSYTRRLSSRAREYQRLPSDKSEYEVDVALAPSAFAFQAVPHINNPFCSRDDSEIATRTMCNTPDSFRRSSMRSPHANPMFLLDTAYSTDDLGVGSQSIEKIPLRHMGSALSYRLSLSGTPENSIFGDDESVTSRPGHARRHSDFSERLGSFKERNKMIRLESIVGGIQNPQGSVIEFGIVDANQFMNMPTPRLGRSSSEKLLSSDEMPHVSTSPPMQLPPPVLLENNKIESYPISFLDDILEEEEDGSIDDYPMFSVDQKSISGDLDSMNEVTTPKHGMTKSSFKIAVQPIEIKEDDGFKNPAFGLDLEWPTPLDSAESIHRNSEDATERRMPMVRINSMKRSSSFKGKKGSSTGSSVKSKRTEKRDEALHVALMERYLLETVVNKYLLE